MAVNPRLKTDLELPEAPNGRLFVTASGDLRTMEDKLNLHSAMRRRTVTTQGGMTHRPLYGGDLMLHVEDVNSPDVRRQMSVEIRRNLLRDPRIEAAKAPVSAGAPSSPLNSFAVTVDISVRIRDDQQDEGFALVLEQ